MQRSIPLPILALLAASQVSLLKFRQQSWPRWIIVVLDGALAYALHLVLSANLKDDESGNDFRSRITIITMIPWWGPMTHVVSLWPRILAKIQKNLSGTTWLSTIAHGGPLGRGCRKLVEILTAFILWKGFHGDWPIISWGPLPHWTTMIVVLVLSLVVNGVLTVWSYITKSRGGHGGVEDMVESTQGRALRVKEHVAIASLAFLNAICEEITSRYFWYKAFAVYLPYDNSVDIPSPSSNRNESSLWTLLFSAQQSTNMAQALVFGLWHYHGIPSGWTGVALTTIYGFLMGLLLQFGQGLLLPVLAHTLADYFIFSVIVRQQQHPSQRHHPKNA